MYYSSEISYLNPYILHPPNLITILPGRWRTNTCCCRPL